MKRAERLVGAPRLDALAAELTRRLGPTGWSRRVDRCRVSCEIVSTGAGPRFVAFAAATLTVALGPAHMPVAIQSDVGHAESHPCRRRSEAIAQAEAGAIAAALERCALALGQVEALDALLGDAGQRLTACGQEVPARLAPPAPQDPGPERAAQRARLEAAGWDAPLAALLTEQPADAPVAPALANQLAATARALHGRALADALWREAGRSPARAAGGGAAPPTGEQALAYALLLDLGVARPEAA